jgi:CRP/FNR family cyclic AMP-dependent transcriptional regulator
MQSPASAARTALLKRSSLFATLPAGDLDRIVQLVRPRRLDAEQVLCTRGDPAESVYAIVSGRVRVISTSEEGKEVVLRVMRAGDVFGELGLLHGGHRTATVVAAEPCELLSIGRREFLALLESDARFSIRLLAVLAARIGDLTDQLSDFVFHGLPVRLAKRLIGLADADGSKTGEGVRISMKLSQQDLANLVGTSRESVNKQLRLWEEDGWIRMDRGAIVLLRREELQELAGLPE